ncbi:MAG: twin-arginine translocase subunit TatC [Actinomycetota bacterium]
MPLRAHLIELRRRIIRSAFAIVAGGIGGWWLAEDVYGALLKPITRAAESNNIPISVNFTDPFSAFNQRLQISVVIGLFLASPIWLYQFWAFITPGLTRKERRYSFGFVAAAVPMFLAGAGLAWLVLPKAVEFLNAFVPEGGTQFITANMYLSFVTRLMVGFGIAFVIPIVLVALTSARLVTGKAIARQWRVVVFVCFLFAALATPTPEVVSMLTLAGAMCLLFTIAVAICLLIDRRRAKRSGEPDYDKLDDDEASPLTSSPPTR